MEMYFYIAIVSSIGAALLFFNKKRKEELIRTRLVQEENVRQQAADEIMRARAVLRTTTRPTISSSYGIYNYGYQQTPDHLTIKQRHRYYIAQS